MYKVRLAYQIIGESKFFSINYAMTINFVEKKVKEYLYS